MTTYTLQDTILSVYICSNKEKVEYKASYLRRLKLTPWEGTEHHNIHILKWQLVRQNGIDSLIKDSYLKLSYLNGFEEIEEIQFLVLSCKFLKIQKRALLVLKSNAHQLVKILVTILLFMWYTINEIFVFRLVVIPLSLPVPHCHRYESHHPCRNAKRSTSSTTNFPKMWEPLATYNVPLTKKRRVLYT